MRRHEKGCTQKIVLSASQRYTEEEEEYQNRLHTAQERIGGKKRRLFQDHLALSTERSGRGNVLHRSGNRNNSARVVDLETDPSQNQKCTRR